MSYIHSKNTFLKQVQMIKWIGLILVCGCSPTSEKNSQIGMSKASKKPNNQFADKMTDEEIRRVNEPLIIPNQLMREARQDILEGKFESAETKLKLALEKAPKAAASGVPLFPCTDLAELYMRRSDYAAAISLLEVSLHNSDSGHLDLGIAYWETGQIDKAREHYNLIPAVISLRRGGQYALDLPDSSTKNGLGAALFLCRAQDSVKVPLFDNGLNDLIRADNLLPGNPLINLELADLIQVQDGSSLESLAKYRVVLANAKDPELKGYMQQRIQEIERYIEAKNHIQNMKK